MTVTHRVFYWVETTSGSWVSTTDIAVLFLDFFLTIRFHDVIVYIPKILLG